ncbi:MAG TPA: MFS transporter [Streptomyces sp.]|nr:MFS transporter [Streptomyces sp.]
MTTLTGAALRRIQTGNALAAFGSGFTVPYLFLYVSRVRGLGAGVAGAALAVFAAAALFVLPFVGRSIDRRGPMPVALGGVGAAAVGALGFGLSGSAGGVLASSALMGAGIAVVQPALATMIVWCSSTTNRSRAFATQFFLNNLGMGFGGLIGGQIVDESRPGTFTVLFAVESAMFVVLAVVLLTVRLPQAAGIDESALSAGPEAGRGSGVRAMLAHRPMLLLCVLGFVLFFTCYGQFESGLAAYAVQVTGMSTSTLGVALFANTTMIALAQFVVLRLVQGRRRSRTIAAVGLVWAAAWLAAGFSGLMPNGQAMATGLLISTFVLFGLGEAMLSPTVAPLVADLAPERMIGRYNSAFALVKQTGVAVGPAVGGVLAAQHAWAGYIVMLVVCALGVSALALRLGRRLTPGQDDPSLVARPAAEPAAQPVAVAG